ncbi:MAG TPA: TonB-dependent receptor [Usitatibacter sp.]|jgi:outer membrane receptor protein involved in Fe transport|nr:TonB-dependent receptor [Usitatibacter sp.]
MGKSPWAIVIACAVPSIALAQAAVPADASDVEVQKTQSIQVIGKRLDEARNLLSPDTGSTVYRFDRRDIETLPLGESTPLNQVILQAPGVVQDSYGQLHVRGDHANIQYRIDGVVIPEPISGFGQAFDARFAERINVLTGALPAQYGYRTAGIVDIHTRGTIPDNGGSLSLLGGSHSHAEADGQLFGSVDSFSYYLTGSFLRNDLGIENPTPERDALHDATRQSKGFGQLSYLLGADSRVSFTFGSADNKFEIPNVPGQDPAFSLAGAPPKPSAGLDARQNEKNSFQVLSYQRSAGQDLDYQISLFHRYTDVTYHPDPVGDLEFNGIAAQILRRNVAGGAQGDMSYRLGDRHTLRAGFFASRERSIVNDSSAVFPADDEGNQASDVPINVQDNGRIFGTLFGLYLQDEWSVTPGLTVNYGLRGDRVDTVVKEGQVSPRVGLVYDLSGRTRIHAGYARYFTPPPTEKIDTTSVALFQGTTNALPSDANTAVKSERSDYYDAGVSHQLTDSTTVGLDAYYRDVRHLQDEGQFGSALIFSAFNYERAKVSGVELSGAYRHGAFSAYANVAFSRAVARGVETGQFNFDPDELDYIARNWVHLDHDQRVAASGGVSYRLGGATLTADLVHGSGLRRGFANSDHLPGYTTVNLGLVHSFDGPAGKLEARLAVVNLLDRTYELRDGTGIGVGAPQFGQRRSFYAGITRRF